MEDSLIIDKILKEMQSVEEFVSTWKVSWAEQLRKCSCEDLYYIGEKEYHELRTKYAGYIELPGIDEDRTKEGLPLRVETLSDNSGNEYDCEFRQIDWNSMNSSNAERTFSFFNNGDITFSKSIRYKETDSSRRNKKMHKQFKRDISYHAKYNVSLSNFSIEIITKELVLKTRSLGPYTSYDTTVDTYSISLIGNLLIKKINDIQIMEDLSTGIKVINIEKKHDKHDRQNNASVVFEAKLNADNNLEAGSVAISTYKHNGKVNGNYRFDVSREKGVRANFYSRKGKKIDLIENPLLLQNAKYLLTSKENTNDSNQIVGNFTKSTETAITKNLPEEIEVIDTPVEEVAVVQNNNERFISFDVTDFNMGAVIEADEKIMSLLKGIKGEIPLEGLRNRIEYCLELIDRPRVEVIEDKPKVLALETK